MTQLAAVGRFTEKVKVGLIRAGAAGAVIVLSMACGVFVVSCWIDRTYIEPRRLRHR